LNEIVFLKRQKMTIAAFIISIVALCAALEALERTRK